ncbi:hypothetical protein ACOSQ4_021073 [Xanthoceras sorbifolium]
MGGRNSDTAGAASTSRRAVTDCLINRNKVKVGAAAPPDSDSVVVQINESKVSSFTRNGVVFMSPKQVIMEECLVENVQQGSLAVVSVLDSVGRVTSRLQTWNREKRKKATLKLKKLRGDLRDLMGAMRNASGVAVFAAAVPLKFCSDVEVAEARAILAGIQLAAERGLLPLLVETDSLNVSRLFYL